MYRLSMVGRPKMPRSALRHGHEVLDHIPLGPTLLGEDDPIGAGDPDLLATDVDIELAGHQRRR